MKEKQNVIKKRYNRISAIYDVMDKMIKKEWREDLLNNLEGEVLEVGVGTGANLPFYPEQVNVTGIDFSEGMLKKAREKANKVGQRASVDLLEMDAQQLAFDDDTFDFIVSTCVYCSVPDPLKGLKEMRRVCKPNGRIVMLEHMRSENPFIGKTMDLLNPFIVRLWGANINRKTLDNIHKAGLVIEENEQLIGTIMRKLILKP
ncbi:class I SAM-dependent methyltransferase [Pontibacillus sp. HMF3514]|uniref:class I SAM-dependent methyltransferase n=1 Tax=Pontibacillus sp. HMF3514 TaxID=2692425 RepID=UPI00131F66D9|nr:methyltransferase domain-containing protein [Pontibacillus sp. HMF3514]QHE52356.1 methyltransferase domain-containing protein [Pontibacillus sp. HMF3514]